MSGESGKWMNTGREDVQIVKYWILNTTNKVKERCMDVKCMNTKYARTETRNTKNNFVELTQLSVRRDHIL